MVTPRARIVMIGVVVGFVLTGCANSIDTPGTTALPASSASAASGSAAAPSADASPSVSTTPTTLTVPADGATISAVVAKAHPGDRIEIGPGVYKETVRVTTPNLTIVGTDRNRVIIDGEVLRANAIVVTVPGVTVANLTTRNALLNGVLFTGMSDTNGGLARGSDGYTHLDPTKFPPLQGFRVSHVTSYNNGLYGIYAFDTQHGLIENTYTSGGADSGIYVGQCKPCQIVVRHNIMERNAIGFELTNAGPDVFVLENRMVHNRVGATINSNHQEAFLPQTGATLIGNYIADNLEPQTPAQADGGFGIGVGIGAGTQNQITRNRISGHPNLGLALSSVDDLAPSENVVAENVLTDNKLDFALASTSRSPASRNCLRGNQLVTTLPADAAITMTCASSATEQGVGLKLPVFTAPPGLAFTEVATPPEQPDLGAALGNVKPWTIDQVPAIELAGIKVPDAELLAATSAYK